MSEDYLIDANIAVRFFVNVEHSEFVSDLFSVLKPVAPDLIFAETMHALRKYQTADFISAENAIIAAKLLPHIIQPIVSATVLQDALKLAFQLEHPVYDCIYAAAAKHAGLTLLTANKKFIRKLSEHKIDLLYIELTHLAETQ